MIDGPWLDRYPPEVAPGIAPVTTDVLGTLGLESADPDLTALDYCGRALTYGELLDSCLRVASGLLAAGLRAGDRLALMAEACPEHLIVLLAALRTGIIVVEHDMNATGHELEALFESHRARLAVVDATRARLVPRGVPAVAIGPDAPAGQHGTDDRPQWAGLLGHDPLAADHPRPGAGDTALLLYTSGSTGRPKGVPLTHAMIGCGIAEHLNMAQDPGLDRGAHFLTLPLHHVFSLVDQLLVTLARRAEIVAFHGLDADAILDAARRRPPSRLATVPPVLEWIATNADRAGVRFDDLFVYTGGLPLTPRIEELWSRISNARPVNGWGMTESTGYGLTPLTRTEVMPAGSCGVPLPGIDVRVCAPGEPTRRLGPGRVGELQLRGPIVFSGYWQDPQATAEAFTSDGFLRTGDLVSMDEQGFFYVRGRLKEIVSVQGENVAPTEVEQLLETVPGIARAFVYARETTPGVNILLAAFTAAPGAAVDPGAALALCERQLAPYKVPMRLTRVDELPLTAAGKLRRDVDGHAWVRGHRAGAR
ncbi:AMP-binding protein [uncultured Propionibacterium sp.]|uniref:class I adenylate-forming enzyme family protein n=1 Tax=uncultured Propionibacterium sp. TaxID=218066 RepID=UPI00292DB699|nr:AMP-binding protein [uncultured Propionibacterium sp.]